MIPAQMKEYSLDENLLASGSPPTAGLHAHCPSSWIKSKCHDLHQEEHPRHHHSHHQSQHHLHHLHHGHHHY